MTITPLPISPVLGVVITVGLLLSLLGLSRLWQVRSGLHPESARKVMHIGMGVIALSFPWVLQQTWAVLLICALTVGVLLGMRHLKVLRRQVGGVLHDVGRQSGGDLYFLLSVAGLYVLAQGDWVLYLIPLLVLTFADGLAALTGVSYGRRKYAGAEGFKSLEGSLAFAAVTFLTTHIPLLLFTNTGRAESLAIAALVALLAMLVEAISWEGLDNLFVPLAAFIALDGHRLASLSVQLEHLAVMTFLTALVFAVRRRTPLTAGALATAALVLYLCMTIGSERWMLAPLTVALAAATLYRLKSAGAKSTEAVPEDQPRPGGYGVRIVASMAAPSLVWLLSARYFGRPEDFFAFSLVWAAQLAGLALFVRQDNSEDAPMRPVTPPEVFSAALIGCALILIPWAVLDGASTTHWLRAAQGSVVVAALLFGCAALALRDQLTFQRQITVLGLAGLAGFLLSFV